MRCVGEWTGLRRAWLVAFSLACLGLMSMGAIGIVRGGDETRLLRGLILAVSAMAWVVSAVIARKIKRSPAENRPSGLEDREPLG